MPRDSEPRDTGVYLEDILEAARKIRLDVVMNKLPALEESVFQLLADISLAGAP